MQITSGATETCSHSRTEMAFESIMGRIEPSCRCLNCGKDLSAQDLKPPTLTNTRSFAQLAAALDDIFDLESVERWNRAYAQMAGWYDDDRMDAARRKTLKFVTDVVRKATP